MQVKEWLLFIVGLAALSLPACSNKPVTAAAETPALPVKIATVESRTVPVEIKAVGSVEPYATITVKSQVTGALTKVYFKEGDFVKEGDILFDIDARPYEEALRQAEANLFKDTALVRQAEANLSRDQAAAEFASTQAGRIRKLAAEGVFAQQQLDQAEADLKARNGMIRASQAAIESAKASLRADEAAISNAKVNLTYCRISSPVAGRTGNLMLKQGNLVKANDVELVAIHQIRPIYVTFSVPEVHLQEVRRQMQGSALRVTAQIQDVRPDSVQGTVTFLDNAVDRSTGSIQLKGTFDNATDKLWPGQFVDVRLRLRELSNATVIPPLALQMGQRGEFVYVLKADDTVELRPVTVAIRSENFLAIGQGLQPGEKVVTDGQVRLAPGSKVKAGS